MNTIGMIQKEIERLELLLAQLTDRAELAWVRNRLSAMSLALSLRIERRVNPDADIEI
jgi:hypothetical protein